MLYRPTMPAWGKFQKEKQEGEELDECHPESSLRGLGMGREQEARGTGKRIDLGLERMAGEGKRLEGHRWVQQLGCNSIKDGPYSGVPC